MQVVNLIKNQSTGYVSSSVPAPGYNRAQTDTFKPSSPGMSIYVSGTIGGASILIEVSQDPPSLPDSDSNWATLDTLTAVGVTRFQVDALKMRASITGGSGTSVSVDAVSLWLGSN